MHPESNIRRLKGMLPAAEMAPHVEPTPDIDVGPMQDFPGDSQPADSFHGYGSQMSQDFASQAQPKLVGGLSGNAQIDARRMAARNAYDAEMARRRSR